MKRLLCTILSVVVVGLLTSTAISCGKNKTAKQQSPEELYETGCQYKNAEKYDKAIQSLSQAAEMGHAFSQRELGEMYAEGLGVERNDALAAEWYRKAAEQGLAHAQFLLAEMYYDGRGVGKDFIVAAEWYLKAAEQGHGQARYCLSEMYALGQGVPEDSEQAAKWLELAAEAGYVEPGI